jgi:hypothetical protein
MRTLVNPYRQIRSINTPLSVSPSPFNTASFLPWFFALKRTKGVDNVQTRAMSAKHWTVRDNEENIIHLELIGKGGFGEVHKVTVDIRKSI